MEFAHITLHQFAERLAKEGKIEELKALAKFYYKDAWLLEFIREHVDADNLDKGLGDQE
jgi:hypothetical protein